MMGKNGNSTVSWCSTIKASEAARPYDGMRDLQV